MEARWVVSKTKHQCGTSERKRMKEHTKPKMPSKRSRTEWRKRADGRGNTALLALPLPSRHYCLGNGYYSRHNSLYRPFPPCIIPSVLLLLKADEALMNEGKKSVPRKRDVLHGHWAVRRLFQLASLQCIQNQSSSQKIHASNKLPADFILHQTVQCFKYKFLSKRHKTQQDFFPFSSNLLSARFLSLRNR